MADAQLGAAQPAGLNCYHAVTPRRVGARKAPKAGTSPSGDGSAWHGDDGCRRPGGGDLRDRGTVGTATAGPSRAAPPTGVVGRLRPRRGTADRAGGHDDRRRAHGHRAGPDPACAVGPWLLLYSFTSASANQPLLTNSHVIQAQEIL
ncbi:hypothetical protein GCM10023238_00830 [Streptomyces heliomycini]